jgi:hypothetical protein
MPYNNQTTMKQLIFIMATMLTFSTELKSQNYVPFPTENAQWNVYLEYSMSENPADTILMQYVLNADTTINQLRYNRLCLQSNASDTACVAPIGGIREKDKRIYFIGNDFLGFPHDEELILYDFNVQVGDTVFHDDYSSFFSIIEAIDTIEINEEYRNRYKISPDSRNSNYYFPDDEYWIEGIGSVKAGLLGHITMVPTCCYQFWEHICFKENGVVKYLNSTFSDCLASNLLMGVNLPMTDLQIKIYPNPVTNQLQIENNSNENLSIKIIDINGRSILEQPLNKTKTTIKLDLRPGIYNALITDQIEQIMLTQKIIKQ